MNTLSFFQPAYLWALGFLSAVLLLHFFRRKVVRRVDISTLRFFPAAAVSQSRVKKLIDILLLLARLLLVSLLILVFAGLHDRRSPLVALRDPQAVVYSWIDPTISMEFAENGKSAGQRAMDVADSLAGILPPSAEHHRFDHESGRFVLTPRRDETAKFEGRFGPVNLEEAVDAFIAASASAPSAIFMVFSDFQKGTADVFDTLSPRLAGGNKTAVCVSFAPSKPYNYAVRAIGGAAAVYAYGAALDSTFIELTVGDLRVGQRSVFCGKDDSVVVTFDMPPAKTGSWGRVELHAADPLPHDNMDYFTVSADRGRTALIVGDIERNKVIGAVLRASAPSFWEPVVQKEGGDLSYEDLNSADLVIVNAFGGRSRILESFISGAGSGKGVILSLDPDNPDDFGAAFLRGAGLSRGKFEANAVENGTHPVLTDTNSALWRGFPAMSSGNANVYRYMSPIPGDALVRLGNSRALASSVRRSGASDLTVISTPIGVSSANNLCETGFFVPFIDRLSRGALSGRGQDEEAWYAGYSARNPYFGTGRAGALYGGDGKLAASWSNQPYVRVDKPGVYSLVSPSGESALYAVSAHPSEGVMVFARPDMEARGVYYFESEQFLEQLGNLSNNAWSYWLWAVLGLILCLEVFLWRGRF